MQSNLPMKVGRIIISVRDMRALVCRYTGSPAQIGMQEAANWQELQEEALAAVAAQGGAMNISGHYVCPEELAARARFED
jgi:hypothetical protein